MHEDLFYGHMAPGLPNPDPLNETLQGFCLCDGSRQCGRKAVSDTTSDPTEPQRNIRLGVPKVKFVAGKRRRKRQTSDEAEDVSADTPRTYSTPYEYVICDAVRQISFYERDKLCTDRWIVCRLSNYANFTQTYACA